LKRHHVAVLAGLGARAASFLALGELCAAGGADLVECFHLFVA
jgi:hypothetical protein